MMRPVLLGLAIICTAMQAAAADELYTEALRIPMAAAGPRGLEALIVRQPGTRRLPLALISHGTPRDAQDRSGMSPNRLYAQAAEFARRGFTALVVMRRGYGGSGGGYADSIGPCERSNYLNAARSSVDDLRAAIDVMRDRTDVTMQDMIAVGVSAGGFASLALAAEPPPELAAVINFAGGRGSRADNEVCSEDALVSAFAAFGKTARVPMLWVYAGNDKFFGPDLAHRLHRAFTAAGGRAEFIDAPDFGSDGHSLFSAAGLSIWTPMVDRFLRKQKLGTAPVTSSATAPAPPAHLRESGRAGWATYLASGPFKAFAVSPKGAYAFRTGQRTASEARDQALAACATFSPDCRVYAVGNELLSN